MLQFEYHKSSLKEVEELGSTFCKQHGDDEHGIIPDAEYDLLFDHLAEVLRQHGTFTEEGEEADFSGYRYVDQIPHICIVPKGASPGAALAAGLQAVSTSHRPLSVEFDFYPEALLILPPNRVFTTFEHSVLAPAE